MNDLTFSNVGSTLQAVGVASTDFNTTVTFAAGADVTELDLVLEAAGQGTRNTTVTIGNVETVNVMSVVDDNDVSLALADATALTIEGDANLTIESLNAAGTKSVSSVDASLFEGDLDLTMGAQTGVLGTTVVTVNSGLGNDIIDVSNVAQRYAVTLGAGDDVVVDTTITDNDSITGGEGVDTLSTVSARVVTGGANALTTANGVNGIDVLELTDALGGNITLATIDSTINTLDLDATSGVLNTTATVTGPAGTLNVELGSATNATGVLGGNLTFVDTGSATTDTLSITNMAEDGSGNNLDVFASTSLTSTGYENVAINTGSATNATGNQDITDLVITADAASANVSVTFTGTNAVDVTLVDTNSTGLTTVDASGLEVLTSALGLSIAGTDLGALGTQSIIGSAGRDSVVVGNFAATIDGGTGNDTLTGGTLADHLHGGEGNDSLTGSGGNDTIHGNEGNDTIDSTAAGVVSIEGGAGNDTVLIGANLGATDVVNGNEGTDTLSVTAAITGTTGVGITNFEVLRSTADQIMTNTVNNTGWTTAQAAAADVDFSNALSTVTTLDVDYAARVVTPGVTTSDLSFARLTDTGTDTLTVATTDFANATPAGDITLTSLTIDMEETVTIDVSNGLSTDPGALTIGTLHAADMTSLTLVGDHNVSIANAIHDNTTLATVNASALTGTANVNASNSAVAVTMTGPATKSATLTGGSGADSITGGSQADSLTGNNGADTLVGNAGNDVLLSGQGADSISAGTGTDSVTAGTGVDTVTLSVDGETDTITQARSDSTAATATNFSGATFAAGDTITFGNGVDVINNFKGGATASGGDILNVGTSTKTNLLGTATSSATIGYLSGTYANGVFTISADGVGPDTLVLQGSALSSNTSRAVVLAGVDSDTLVNGNFAGTDTSVYTPGVAFSVTTSTGAFNPTTTYANAAAAVAAGVSTVAGSTGVTDTIITTGDAASVTFNFNTGALTGGTDASANQLVYQNFDTFTAGVGAGAASVTDAAGIQTVNIGNAANNTLVFSGGGADVLANTGSGLTTTTLSANGGSLTSTASGTAASTITATGTSSLSHTNTGTGTDTIVVGAASPAVTYNAVGGNNTGSVTFNGAMIAADSVVFDAADTSTVTLNVGQDIGTNINGLVNVDTLALGSTTDSYTLTLAAGDLTSGATIRNVTGTVMAGNVTINSVNNAGTQTINLNSGATYTGTGSFTLNGGQVNTVTSGSGTDGVTIAALNGAIGTSVLSTNLGNGTNTIQATLATGSIAADDVTIVGGSGTDNTTFTMAGALTFAADASDLQAQSSLTFNGTSTGTVTWTSADADITKNLTVTVGSGVTGAKLFDLDVAGSALTTWIHGSYYSTAGATADKFIANGGADTLTVYGGAGVTNDDTLVGGGGTDALTFDLNGSALSDNVSGVAATTFGGWETINITNTSATAATASLIVENTTNQAGLTLIDASTLAAGNGATLSNTGAAAITIKGGAGDDSITGGTGGDTLHTGSGVNTVAGGLGVDTINLDAAANQIDVVVLGTDQLINNATYNFGATMAEGTDAVNDFDWASTPTGDYVSISKGDLNKDITKAFTLIDAVTGTDFNAVARGSLSFADVANGQSVTSTTQQAFRLTTGASTAADALGSGSLNLKTGGAFAGDEGVLVLWYDTDTNEVVFTAVTGTDTASDVVAADFANQTAADLYRIDGISYADFVGISAANLANSVAIF